MSPSAPSHSSPRRSPNSPSTRRASAGPRGLSSASASPTSPSYTQAGYNFSTAAAIQIDRTVSVTVEVLSGSALESHMGASQYPVTTSCYSPYAAASEYGTSISQSSQGNNPFTPPTTSGSSSSYYGQSSASGGQGSHEYPYGSSEYHSASSSVHQQQQGQYPPASGVGYCC